MVSFDIRDIGKKRMAALDVEARAQGITLSELVRRLLDDGINRGRAAREREEWLASARAGLAYETQALRTRKPSLARLRPTGDTDIR